MKNWAKAFLAIVFLIVVFILVVFGLVWPILKGLAVFKFLFS